MRKFWNKNVREPLIRTMVGVPWFGPVIMAVLVSLIVNVLTTALVVWGGLVLAWIIVFVAILAAVLFVVAYDKSERRRRAVGLGPIDLPNPDKHTGLIFMFSREDTLREALKYHSPMIEHVWLIVTPELQSRAAEAITHYPDVTFTIRSLTNLYDTQACYRIVSDIYQNAVPEKKQNPKRVISDITGGTKPMSMGMIVACVQGGYPIEHVPTKFDDEGKPLGPLPPIQIVLHNAQPAPLSTI